MPGIAIGHGAVAGRHAGGGRTHALDPPAHVTAPGAEPGTVLAPVTEAAPGIDHDPDRAPGIVAARAKGPGPGQYRERGIVIGIVLVHEMLKEEETEETEAVHEPHSRTAALRWMLPKMINLVSSLKKLEHNFSVLYWVY